MSIRMVEELPYTLFFKYQHADHEFRTVTLLKRRRGRNVPALCTTPLEGPYSGPLPIKAAKLKDLLGLKDIIPMEYHAFYDNLNQHDTESNSESDEDSD